jgi:hypothetical protein
MQLGFAMKAVRCLVRALAALILTAAQLSSQQVMQLRNQIWGHLEVVTLDRDSAKLVPARCYLTDSAGRNWTPSGAITYVKPPEVDFIGQGEFEISLPPGAYTLRVEHGTEFRRLQRRVEIRPGEICHERLELERWAGMNARGWYSGDLHNHRDWREMPQILLSEDLNLSPTLTRWVWDERLISIPPPAGESLRAIRAVDAAHAYSILDTEIERLEMGSIDLIGLRAPLEFRGSKLYPPSNVFTEVAHRQGGYVDAEKITWRDGTALIALGQVDFAGLVYNSFSPFGVEPTADRSEDDVPDRLPYWAMEVYYKLLNCGFRLPVSAGTASGVKPTPLGYDRVYVHLREPFSYDAWFHALKDGRSFATNGPILFLTVDGNEPGDTIELAAGPQEKKQLRIRAEAVSQDDLEKLEVIWRGKVIRTINAPPGSHRIAADFEADANQTGWFAARAFEKPAVTVRFAHTSPVYVRVGDDRGIVSQDADYFVASMDQAIAFFKSAAGFRSPTERDAMLSMFKQAREVYRRLASK